MALRTRFSAISIRELHEGSGLQCIVRTIFFDFFLWCRVRWLAVVDVTGL